MSERATHLVIAMALVALCAAACNQECDCPDCGGAGGDAGVICESEPGSCAELGDVEAQHFGCCHGDTVYWCDGDVLEWVDCAAGGYDCGFSESSDYMDCI